MPAESRASPEESRAESTTAEPRGTSLFRSQRDRSLVEALQASEDRLRAIVDTAADAIVTIDRRGVVESVNRATERMFGYRAEEIVGKRVSLLLPSPHPEEQDEHLARYLETGPDRVPGRGREVVGLRKDGSTFPADMTVSDVDHLNLFTGIIRDVSERKRLEALLAGIATTEQERIGRDLHDTVGQDLAGLALYAERASHRFEGQPGAEVLRELAEGIRKAVAEVRTAARGLTRAAVDVESLVLALEELAASVREHHRIDCVLEAKPPARLTGTVASHLYRIAAEAVSNAVRHAQATRIAIRLGPEGDRLVLRVSDDGTGLPADPDSDGLGIWIMRRRAAAIRAELDVGPAGTRGTAVTCSLKKKGERWKSGPTRSSSGS